MVLLIVVFAAGVIAGFWLSAMVCAAHCADCRQEQALKDPAYY